MLRRVMGAFVALMLVATLFMPLASVGAQEEVNPGEVPATTEQTQPESAPSAVDTEPPVAGSEPDAPAAEPPVEELQPEAPAVEQPVDETQPEAPVVDDVEQSAAAETNDAESDGPVPVPADEATTIQAAAETEVEPSDEGGPTVIENLSIDCTGLLTYDVVEAHGEELGVLIKTTDPNVATGPEGDIDGFVLFINSEGHSSSTVDISGNPGNVYVTINSSAVGGPIAESPIVSCHEITEPEPDPEPEPGPVSAISSVSVTCDGTVTFTISEAQGETLWIAVTDPRAPYPHNQLASGSFDAVETGTFTVEFAIDSRDTVGAEITSSNDEYGLSSVSVFTPNCQSEDDEIEAGFVADLTVACDGTVSLTAHTVGLNAGLTLFGFNGSSWQRIGVAPLFAEGPVTHSFDVPAGVWDSLRIEAAMKYTLFGVAEVRGCLDDEPDPEPTDGPEISNLRLFCNGMVRFDLESVDPVTLDLVLTATGADPEYMRNTQVTLGDGSQQVQFGVPVTWFDDWDVTISLGDEVLAQTSVTGCLTTDPNDVTGDEIMVATTYGFVIFERVTEGGETVIERYVDPIPGEFPEAFELDSARLFNLSTTATFEGSIEVCLALSQDMIDQPDRVRVLQYWHGAWIEADTEVHGDLGLACVSATRLSIFATALLAGEPEPVLPVVTNLTVDCDGLVTFDLESSEPVTLDVWFFIPASAPGYRDIAQITASTGPQQVQLTPRSNGAFEWYASVLMGNDELAYASVQGCPFRLPNTMPGVDVVVEVGGGTITFDEVLEVGDTTVTELDPGEAPALPAEFDGYQVILLDITTTAQFAGSVQICLPVAADAEQVRLLHYENGAWVDITTSTGNGQVCGTTSSFSPFAIVHLTNEKPDGSDQPDHPGPGSGSGHPTGHDGSATDGAQATGLPNTGSGSQGAGGNAETLQLLLSALAVLALACGLRRDTTWMTAVRSR